VDPWETREGGLTEFHQRFSLPLFAEHGFNVPDNIRFSTGWPSVGALAKRKRRIGECWYPDSSAAQDHNIIVSLVRSDPFDVAETAIHEVCHTIAGADAGHKAPFKRVAVAVGLAGKMTATELGAELRERLHAFLPSIPPYPHAMVDGSGRKKQSTRMLKALCPRCGEYLVRLSRKVADMGLPECPVCKVGMELS
jgi:hypothetical protein